MPTNHISVIGHTVSTLFSQCCLPWHDLWKRHEYRILFEVKSRRALLLSSHREVPEVGCRKRLTVRLVKSDWCPQPSQLLRRDEGEQVMQSGLEAACWHLTSGAVIKNTLWQRQHLVVHSKPKPNSSVVLHYPGRTCTVDERCAAKLKITFALLNGALSKLKTITM